MLSSVVASAKYVMAVSLLGSRPFATSAWLTAAGKRKSIGFGRSALFCPVDGSDATYRSSSGFTSSTLNVPTMKNVKSAALLKALT